MGNRVHYSSPRNVYRTQDDEYVALSGSTANTAKRVLIAIERPDLVDDPKFASNSARLENADELDALIADWIARHPFDFVLDRFEELGAALAPVLGIERISKNEHFRDRNAIIEVPDEELGSIKMQGVFPRLTRTPGRVDWAGGVIGMHQEEVFGPSPQTIGGEAESGSD